MPAQLPSEARDRIPDPAIQLIGLNGAIETYATVDFVGQSTNPGAFGPLVEIDEDSWTERGIWHFEEISETNERVELYDESRGTTLIIDYTTGLIHVLDAAGNSVYDYDVTGVTYSLDPVEVYATVDFVGRDTGPYANPDAIGPIVEVDENSWIEANTWHFEEVSETSERVVLFDDSRDVTIVIDYTTNEISVINSANELVYIYDVTAVDYSMTPVDTFATVDFVGRETGPYANPDAIGPIVEVDENSWIEANTWHFEEVSETSERVVLFDDSRDVTIVIDYTTNEISVINSANELVYIYDVTGVDYSMTPVIPDGWIIPG